MTDGPIPTARSLAEGEYLHDHDLRGRPGMAHGESIDPDRLPLNVALGLLQERLDSLDKTVAILADRLHPISVEMASTPTPGSVQVALPHSPITGDVLRASARVEETDDWLGRITRAIAI